ncbi:MAG: tetratricopeptide repeat protein [Rudaea sp.]|uniref:tetratricopeptide repeat protein n=1 Tax=Rudaea sp. TaxID=2136325 RepID=UPI0039E6341E
MNADPKRLAAEQLQQGIARQRTGQSAAALSHFQRAAKLDPANAQTWHLLGVCALQTGNPALAAKHFRTCLKLEPGSAETHNNLGVVLRRLGRHAEAIESFRAALAIRPDHASASYNLGLSLEALNVPGEAEKMYRQALRTRANDFNAANALGSLLHRTGRSEEALPLLRLARQLQPDNAHANGTLAQALIERARAREALGHAQTATALEPVFAPWWAVRGRAERLVHDVGAAIVSLRRAIELAPDDWISRCELGLALAEAGEIEESRTLLTTMQVGEQVAERLRWTVLLSLPSVYADEAGIGAERERYARGLDEIDANLRLDTPAQRHYACEAACGVAPFQLDYQARDNTALHGRFGDIVTRVMHAAAPRLAQPCEWRARAHAGRIRVGIVSSHLMHHTVSRYFRKLIAGLNPARFEVRVWYSGETRDFSTEYIGARVAAFEQVGEDVLSSAQRIRAVQLDALIYAEIGMDPRHHVLGALRLAPVQAVLYGHPATSGLANIDYFLGADALEPENAQAHYCEKLVRLPALGTVPERPPAAGDGAWLDAFAGAGPITLCLQNHLKLAPSFDAVLARIAQRSGARIGFFVRNTGVAQRFRRRIEATFAAHGLDPARALAFLPAKKHEDYLGAVARATLILDTPGFSGGATSLDAFSAGAPVLTWKGAMARGRQTQGMLALMGVDGLIAADDDDYVDKAVALLADESHRAALRAQILARNAVLFEDNGVVAALEDFLDAATRQAAEN